MDHWIVDFISRQNDFDVSFKGIPADTSAEAIEFARCMLAVPSAWLNVGTDKDRHHAE